MARRKLVRRYKGRKKQRRSEERAAPRRNPPLITELAEFIGPGFAGFAAARFTTHIAATQIAKRKPGWGKHAGGAAAIAAFLAAWLLAHRWKWLSKWHTPIVVGAGLAALQSLIQLYIPKLGWMISDATPELGAGTSQQQITAGGGSQLPDDLTATDDDPNLYVYDDRYDSGRMSAPAPPPRSTGNGQAAAQQQAQQTDDDLADLDLEDAVGQTQQLGVFGAGN